MAEVKEILSKILPLDFKKQREVLKICVGCPSVKRTRFIGLTCGTFLFPGDNPKTCGCKLSLKGLIKGDLTSCPQNKW